MRVENPSRKAALLRPKKRLPPALISQRALLKTLQSKTHRLPQVPMKVLRSKKHQLQPVQPKATFLQKKH